MLANLASIIADFFVQNSTIQSEEKEIYIYGCEAIFSSIINVFIVILCGLIMGEFWNAILFYVVFLAMRKYCGGYHADTHLKCGFIFAINTIVALFLIKNSHLINYSFLILSIFVSDIIIFWLTPMENKNKPLSQSETSRFRRISLFFTVGFTVIAVLLMYFSKTVSMIIILALLSVAVAMLTARLIKKRGE